ncbi:MAG: hypothetical protein DLM53_03325 [Candidatus Eremiobacter antarcticus]|nr:MAG: hypothetical protein DLM53_03325 [Candidatus Eremiobacter sp. RRmetagenome_bin22]
MVVICALVLSALCAGSVTHAAPAANTDLDREMTVARGCSSTAYIVGSLQEVQADRLLIKLVNRSSWHRLLIARAQVHRNGARLSEGAIVRARGCFVEDRATHTDFRAIELTVYPDLEDYRNAQRAAGSPDETANRVTAAQPRPNTPHVVAPHAASAVSGVCGGYRWPVKIAADAGAANINNSPQDTTVSQLDAMRPSAVLPSAARVPAETAVYRLSNVTLTSMYVEHDRDYHLIVKDSSGASTTLESPDASCARASAFANQIAAVRNYLSSHFAVSGTIHPNVPLSATGIAFFDPGGSGGLELHPLLSVCVGQDCSPSAQTGTLERAGRRR